MNALARLELFFDRIKDMEFETKLIHIDDNSNTSYVDYWCYDCDITFAEVEVTGGSYHNPDTSSHRNPSTFIINKTKECKELRLKGTIDQLYKFAVFANRRVRNSNESYVYDNVILTEFINLFVDFDMVSEFTPKQKALMNSCL